MSEVWYIQIMLYCFKLSMCDAAAKFYVWLVSLAGITCIQCIDTVYTRCTNKKQSLRKNSLAQ